jgi:hypothetical protein
MALFTRKACRGVSVAGGGVSLASGMVPTTAMVTATAADGAAPASLGSVLGKEVEGLQADTVSTSQYQHTAIQQGSKSIPGRFDCFSFSLPHQPTTLRSKVEFRSTPRLARRSCAFSPLLRLLSPPGGSHPPWSRCYAEPGLCEPSLLRQRRWGGGGPAGGCWVMAGSCGIVLCVPAEGFQLAPAE